MNEIALLGPVCALLSSVTWAFGSTKYSVLSGRYAPFAVNFSRALVAFPLFVAMVFFTEGVNGGIAAFGSVQGQHIFLLALGMIGSYGLGDACFLWSAQSIGVPGALSIASTYPLSTTIAGMIFRGDKLGMGQFIGLLVVIAGVIIVIRSLPNVRDQARSRGAKNLGLVLAFLTSFLWAINSFVVSKVGTVLQPSVINSVRMAVALVVTFAMGTFVFRAKPALLPLREFKSSLWLFVYEAFGGAYLYVYGLSHSPLVVGATLSSLAPVLSVPIAWIMRTEKPSVKRSLGVIAVVFGLWLLVL